MLYKFIDFPNFKETQEEILKKIPRISFTYGYRVLDVKRYNNFTKLKYGIEKFTSWNNIFQIVTICSREFNISPIHTDYTQEGFNPYVLNLPLLNCDHPLSYTLIYKGIQGVKGPIDETNITLEILDKFYLIKPAFLNVLFPHRVENKSDVPRLILSIRFKEQFNF